ncbi:hypothetical protein P5V34_04800 [Mycobacteroides abscessus subsp. abscessus]|jgi:hypothetical protein|uniref:hypothetical protein n=1 Tax=Mycobacteroides abscessus TaxID=36809 RepID=UPI00266BD422|nr:hypothetical protein [Mycobacteroides abscessus]MDO3013306.1 hypothetical protein [Mycobacteroides abscessus subsp. abscessus]
MSIQSTWPIEVEWHEIHATWTGITHTGLTYETVDDANEELALLAAANRADLGAVLAPDADSEVAGALAVTITRPDFDATYIPKYVLAYAPAR